MKVEAIEWTGSGDGIVAGGIEVVLWKRRNRSWEIAWQFKADQAQDLVSATWSIEGPSAIAAKWEDSHVKGSYEPRKCATVCHDYGESDYAKIELPHPQPISMIQWRPSKVRKMLNETKKLTRNILLTCCIDGTVRLWSEIDDRRVKKMGKDGTPRKATRRSFCVAAVIEVNQGLNGTLGVDIFVRWATEVVGAYRTSEGTNKILSAERNTFHTAGHCEWLIGIGPGPLVTFWAIHCLDDISPMRFPRVTLWKRHELQGHELALSHRTDLAYCEGVLLLEKVVIFRNCPSEPPTTCSLIRLLPSKSLSWSLIHMKTLDNSDDTSLGKSGAENFLLSSAEVLNIDGHTGEILQVSVHSLVSDIELAASLDSNGLVLFWSISSVCNSILGHPSLIPAWNIFGKFVSQVPGSNYTSIAWAPSVLGVDRVLLIGHAGGIDCFIVKVPQSEEEGVICHLVSTIPLTSDRIFADGPTNIFAISLPSTCNKTFLYNRFLLLGVWMKGFQAISWEVIMHSYDSMGSHCDCNFDDISSAGSSTWKVEDTFAGRRYCIRISPSSSYFPEPHRKDQVLSFAVVSSGCLTAVQEKLNVSDDFCRNHAYVLATGLSDGTVKLWSNLKKQSATPVFWKLVGFFVANQGPVDHICLSSCGRKIATVCAESHSPAVSTLKIWDSVHLVESGNFMLEDTLPLATNIVALNWMTLGNGHLLLGVCLQNQLWVFASKNCRGQDSKWSMKMQIWFHIAVGHTFPTIHDFLWGPRATAVVRHATHLSIFSPWLFLLGKNSSKYGSNLNGERAFDCQNGTHEEFHHRVFSYSEIPDLKDSSSGNSKGECNSGFLGENKLQIHNLLGSLLIAGSWLKRDPDIIQGFWRMLDIAEMLVGLLPTYHPEALFTNIYSGKWKRAYASVRHLVEYFKSNYASERTNSRAKSNNTVPQILLSNYFDGFPGSNSNQKELQWSGNVASSTYLPFQSKVMPFSYNSAPETSPSIFSSSSTQSEVNDFLEAIEEFYESDNLGTAEKKQLLAIVHLLNEISNTASVYETLDEAGKRFWITLRYHQLQFEQKFGRPSSFQDSVVDSEAMAWAFHSDCQESLLNAVLPAEPSWQEMRTLGVGYWLTNVTVLRARMEKLARLQYLKKRDPKDCTLLYVALNRLQVLAGLFKISRDEKDKPLVGFLLRNFQEEKNRAAALKNAYVLMGRHQLELAVAFFLLGGDASSAVTVCTKNLGDEQLALVICRLVEGCGGPLECHLITKSIIPSAVERGDYWLASLMDWGLGNFSRSFMIMLGFQEDFIGDISTLSLSHVAFTDPRIGLYCFMLANKNSMKNAIGERAAALLGRWACLMLATSLNRHGLPLEAVEWCSSSISTRGFSNQGTTSETWSSQILHGNVKQSAGDSSNWLLGNVSSWLESQVKLNLALQYISRLMKEHPSWPITSKGLTRRQSEGCRFYQYDKLLENFMQKVETGLSQFEQKFSLPSSCLVNMNFVSLCNNGLVFIGYDVLRIYTSQGHSQDDKQTVDSPFLYSLMYKLHLQETEDISFLFSHFITACSMICSIVKSDYNENDLSSEARTRSLKAWWYYFQSLLQSLWSLRASARIFSNILKEDNMLELLDLLDLYEFYTHLAVALLHGNYEGLVLMIQPLSAYFRGQPDSEIDISDMSKVFPKVADMIAHASIKGAADQFNINKFTECRQAVELVCSIPEDERCYIIRACLWQRLFRFLQHRLHSKSIKLNDSYPFTMSSRKLSCLALSVNYGSDSDNITEKTSPLGIMSKLLITALEHISSYHIKALALFLHQKGESGFQTPTLMWLKRSKRSLGILHQHENQDSATGDMTNRMLEPCVSETLWDTCVDPTIINEGLVQEKIEWSSYFQSKPSKGWLDMYDSITGKQVNAEPCEHDRRISNNSPIGEVGSSSRSLLANAYTFLGSRRKDIHSEKDVSLFQIPEEIYKRNGELLEALCINSIDERQAALASNRKGIIFFNWEDDPSFTCQLDYIWSDADWPHNGWAGSMSTLVPTCMSASAGLGSKKGAQLGLGGATVVVGSLARPGRDLRGSGSSGIQGYAGIASSGLRWEAHEDFVDKQATVENISTRAFSSHPSRPLFLVGSSNTHIYLWEFGKDKATATYGVLPVANVPPPYALASISALQFDHFGHRFASAALDGRVCTWQLEVGGRSNICPTESSVCFNSHASDVTYVTSSGSVIAAAGCSSNGMNVVIWDTLAPPASSRASIVCHQGGARSISLFDNHIGSGSVSPLIVSGGKGGDVGVHDFRYIATGKTKRHKHLDSESTTSTADLHSGTGNTSQFGDHNKNGMLWYIPKAHLGSVTKVRTIPNTSLFLTGSKDGDVKLWDAEAARLLYHWPKLHERHTFLQPSSRGYGGVIRAAVTDIQVASHGFLTCGGDGSVKLIKFKDQCDGA